MSETQETHSPGMYSIGFSSSDWMEIATFSFDQFAIPGSRMTRRQWLALAHMCMGKSIMVRAGHYNIGQEGEDELNREWSAQLRRIARTILDFFKPGDGKT